MAGIMQANCASQKEAPTAHCGVLRGRVSPISRQKTVR